MMGLTLTAPREGRCQATEDSSEKVRPSLWSRIWNVISVVFLLIVLTIATVSIVVPKIMGAIPMTILSNSMAPHMPVGSLAVVKPTLAVVTQSESSLLLPEDIAKLNNTRDLIAGDIVAFQPNESDDTLVIHRIIAVAVRADGSREFTTKGDNNSGSELVEDYMIRGEVRYSLPYIGYINNFVNADSDFRRIMATMLIVALYGWAGMLGYRALVIRRQQEE